MAKASLCLPSHERKSNSPHSGRPEKRQSLSLDQPVASFLGAGIRITRIASDMKSIDLEMKLRFWNANHVGTHFGGSLFAMTDAFYMLMLMHHLERDYIVWDKAATIRYKRPGRGPVCAEFRLTDARVEDVREKLKALEKYEPVFVVEGER
jgi:acyl-coenzyme A thioesterase PaaI-like protein